jgi:hypothetical protein
VTDEGAAQRGEKKERAMNETLVPHLKGEQARKALAEAVTALFDRWHLSQADQLILLGLTDSEALVGYRQGMPLPDDPDLLVRVGHLLAIYRALQEIYGRDPVLCDWWMLAKDFLLGNRSPLEVVRKEGLEGLKVIRRSLEKS